MANPTQQVFDRVYSTAVALLKGVGFKKSGRTLYRLGVDCSDVINLQASQWNTTDDMKFTANIGVHQVHLAEELGRQRASLPKRFEDCMLHERIGWVMPTQRDFWWRIDSEHSEEQAASSLASAVEAWVLPWFERCKNRDTLIEFLSARTGWGPADMLLLLGKPELAVGAMESITTELPGREEAITRWKSMHGIADV